MNEGRTKKEALARTRPTQFIFQFSSRVRSSFPKTLEAARGGVGRRRDVARDKDTPRVLSPTVLLEKVSFAATPDENQTIIQMVLFDGFDFPFTVWFPKTKRETAAHWPS